MRFSLALLFTLAVAACAGGPAERDIPGDLTYLPDGSRGYAITCNPPFSDYGDCLQRAGRICEETGYTDWTRPRGTRPATRSWPSEAWPFDATRRPAFIRPMKRAGPIELPEPVRAAAGPRAASLSRLYDCLEPGLPHRSQGIGMQVRRVDGDVDCFWFSLPEKPCDGKNGIVVPAGPFGRGPRGLFHDTVCLGSKGGELDGGKIIVQCVAQDSDAWARMADVLSRAVPSRAVPSWPGASYPIAWQENRVIAV